MLSKIEKAIGSVGVTVGGFVIVVGSIAAIRMVADIQTLKAETLAIEASCEQTLAAHHARIAAKAPATAPPTAPADKHDHVATLQGEVFP